MLGAPSLPHALPQVPIGLEETNSVAQGHGDCDPSRRCRALRRWPLQGLLGSPRGDGSPTSRTGAVGYREVSWVWAPGSLRVQSKCSRHGCSGYQSL